MRLVADESREISTDASQKSASDCPNRQFTLAARRSSSHGFPMVAAIGREAGMHGLRDEDRLPVPPRLVPLPSPEQDPDEAQQGYSGRVYAVPCLWRE